MYDMCTVAINTVFLVHVCVSVNRLEKTIRGEMFSPKELSDIKRFMQIALEQAKSKVYTGINY